MFGFIRNYFANRKILRDRTIVLEALQSPQYEFRSKASLAAKIGTTDSAYLDRILNAIGTRSAYRNTALVGLVSRIGERPRRLAAN